MPPCCILGKVHTNTYLVYGQVDFMLCCRCTGQHSVLRSISIYGLFWRTPEPSGHPRRRRAGHHHAVSFLSRPPFVVVSWYPGSTSVRPKDISFMHGWRGALRRRALARRRKPACCSEREHLTCRHWATRRFLQGNDGGRGIDELMRRGSPFLAARWNILVLVNPFVWLSRSYNIISSNWVGSTQGYGVPTEYRESKIPNDAIPGSAHGRISCVARVFPRHAQGRHTGTLTCCKMGSPLGCQIGGDIVTDLRNAEHTTELQEGILAGLSLSR